MEVCPGSPIVATLTRDAGRSPWKRLLDWVAESRSHRVICIVCGILLLNAFDLVLTMVSHQQGVLHEQNPVARQMLRSGPSTIVLYKIGLVFIGCYPLLKFRRARITELASLVIMLAYVILAVRWSTYYELYCAIFPSDTNVSDVALTIGAVHH
ncbi:MAG: hypothetical protein JSU63_18950 [Phycisphaerales bacterium]|nr:MAG: hypothetical protein JSU63_18950 [Phycisphaerales bacterium]